MNLWLNQKEKDVQRKVPHDRQRIGARGTLLYIRAMGASLVHDQAMEKRIAATRAFYNALSPSQQKAFDALDLEGGMGDHVIIRRFETRGAPVFHGGDKAPPQRKVG